MSARKASPAKGRTRKTKASRSGAEESDASAKPDAAGTADATSKKKPSRGDEGLNALLRSKVSAYTDVSKAHRASMNELVEAMRADEAKLREGGGAKAIAKQHDKGRLTARERIDRLIDPGSEFFELMIFAAWGMYEEWGTPPAAGAVTGIATVCGRQFMVIANDATVKAGAFFPMTAKKVIRAQRIALQNRLPVIYLVDSAGVFLPLQDEIFPDEDDFGRVFRHNAVLSAEGIPQIAAIMGMCVAGGAYLPVMCDTVLMTEGSGLFLAGPALVRAAIGQNVSAEELGGAKMHSEISGTVDFREPDDEHCIDRIRRIVDKMGPRPKAPFDRSEAFDPLYDSNDLDVVMPTDGTSEYDVREIITRLVDQSEFDEYRKEYGGSIVCGMARIGGYAVGIVANQKTHKREPGKPIEFGGVIYRESAEKSARFILDCNQNRIPLVFLHDVNGFMVGRDAEHSGIIRAGAKMVNAVSNSVVPKISIIIGGSFGAGHYAMCGRAYDPRFLFAWPNSRYAVMGGAAASSTLTDLRVLQLKKSGKEPTDEEIAELRADTERRYGDALDPRYAAARLWTDKIIHPRQTRSAIIQALDVASHDTVAGEFRTGVFQA